MFLILLSSLEGHETMRHLWKSDQNLNWFSVFQAQLMKKITLFYIP